MIAVQKVDSTAIPLIRSMANIIWPLAYEDIISSEQISYMLQLFYSESSLLEQAEKQQHEFIIATHGKEPVGFASYSLKNENPLVYHLHKLYVIPQQHQNGIGRTLLQYIVHEIRSKAGCSLELNVNRHNKAIHFYRKQGFYITREEDIDIGNGFFMNDYVMELNIEPIV